MIKNASITTINLYQIFVSPILKNLLGINGMCRFDETCSNYAKRMIKENGAIRGSGKGFVRFLKCNPLMS